MWEVGAVRGDAQQAGLLACASWSGRMDGGLLIVFFLVRVLRRGTRAIGKAAGLRDLIRGPVAGGLLVYFVCQWGVSV